MGQGRRAGCGSEMCRRASGQAAVLHKVARVGSEMRMKLGGGGVSPCEDAPGLRVSVMWSSRSKTGSVPVCSRSKEVSVAWS